MLLWNGWANTKGRSRGGQARRFVPIFQPSQGLAAADRDLLGLIPDNNP
ncbi:hypothetical protein QT970_09985 [Microcoleus sp. herbarium8]